MTKSSRHYGVKPGDVWLLGRHRLMCGNSKSAADVARLFDGAKADLVVTSPPYANARDYTLKIPCWDTLLRKVFWNIPETETTQLLVNLGVIHQNGEWVPYWWNWLQNMREVGWRHYSLYIWDKLMALPGDFQGRLKPSHEFVFHLNKKAIPANRSTKTKHPGRAKPKSVDVRDKKGFARMRIRKIPVNPETKVPDSVIRAFPCFGNEASGHPAQYSVAFASTLVATWGEDSGTVYDPFCGSATTLLACETERRRGYGMEVAPEYVEISLNRWSELYPAAAPRLEGAP